MHHKEVRALKSLVQARHHCRALFIKTTPVRQISEGKTAWEGQVAIFKIQKNPASTRCYAWTFKEGGETKSAALLEIPPVDSAQSAVRIAMAERAQRK